MRKLRGNEVPKEAIIYAIVELTVSEPGIEPKTSVAQFPAWVP